MAALFEWLAYSGARKADGTAVSSGRAYFYQPGTLNTQVQVYSDKDGLIALAQPVALDASGRAVVYSKVPVRVEVQQAVDNAVVRVEDRANTINAQQVEIEHPSYMGTSLVNGTQVLGGRTDLHTVLSGVSGTGGATDGNYYQESAGATARTMQAAIGDVIKPQDFGAVADGVTNDTAAFNLAVARALSSNKPLWLEPGTYVLTGPISISGGTAVGLRIIGANRSACILRNTSAGANMLTVDLGSAIESEMELANFTIANAAVSTGKGIEVLNGNGILIRGVTVSGHTYGFETTAVAYARLEECTVTSLAGNSSSRGFRLGTQCSARNCRVLDATNGRAFQFNGQYSRADMCRAVAVGGTGFDMLTSDCLCFGCVVTGAASYGFYVGAVSRSGCANCTSSAATNDYATDAGAVSPVDLTNVFATRAIAEYGGQKFNVRQPVSTKTRAEVTGASTVTPDPRLGEIFIYHVTAGGAFTLTVGATGTAGLADGQRMRVIVENAQGGSTVTLSWNAQYKSGIKTALTTSVTAAGGSGRPIVVIDFVWRSSNSTWVGLDYAALMGDHTGISGGLW